MYRFGDGTPFPIQENFIETLLAAVDACVGAFAAAAEIDDRREKAKAARRDAEEELRRLGVMEGAVQTALAPMKPSVDKLASPSAQAAARALTASRNAIAQSRKEVEARIALLAGEPRAEKALERARTAMARFFDVHQLPDTQWRWSWHWNGARPVGDATATSGRFRATYDLELEGPWCGVARVGALVPGLHAVMPRKNVFGKRKRARVSLDKCGIVLVEQGPEQEVMVIREHAARPSEGWRVRIGDDGASVTVTPVDLTLRGVGDEIVLDGAEAQPLLALWTAADDAMLALVADRRHLRELWIGEASLDTMPDPGVVSRALLGVLGPIVRQIRTRSRVPGELAIKRDIGDGRREELYAPRDHIERKFAMLPPTYRRPFEDIGLGRQATAEIASADEAVTSEAPPRGMEKKPAEKRSAEPPPPPVPQRLLEKADALAKLPGVPPTLPRVPPLRADDTDAEAA